MRRQTLRFGPYEAGSSRAVTFDRPGICYIFCNIHPQMSAVIVVVATPHWGITDRSGTVTIPHVPPGRYMLHVWHERSLQETLNALTRKVSVSESSHSLGTLRVRDNHPGRQHVVRARIFVRPVDPEARSLASTQSISGDAGGDDWHNALPSQFLHEQIQETGLHRVQRGDPNRSLPLKCLFCTTNVISSILGIRLYCS